MRSSWLRDQAESLLVVIAIALVLRFFVVSGFMVTTNSTEPVYVPGDLLIVFKLGAGVRVPGFEEKLFVRSPARDSWIVFSDQASPQLFKPRIVTGLPGDRVEIREGIS